MPFGPLYRAPGLALKVLAARHISLLAFGIVQWAGIPKMRSATCVASARGPSKRPRISPVDWSSPAWFFPDRRAGDLLKADPV